MVVLASPAVLAGLACGGDAAPANLAAQRPTSLGGASDKGSGDERCDVTGPDREASEYDTSGDQVPDVRKVYLAVGTGMDQRLVVICRETDLNGDGRKDVIRYYDDEGRSLREEADRNFDGKVDRATQFQNGEIVREDSDENRDGKMDLRVFYDRGAPLRAERDLAGRSTPAEWHPDRWEYYEAGRIVRMGTDVDGDSRVDRWDRDATFKRPGDDATAQAVHGAAAEASGAAAAGGSAAPAPGSTPAPAGGGAAAPASGASAAPAGGGSTAPATKSKASSGGAGSGG